MMMFSSALKVASCGGRTDDESARQPLAAIVVRVAFEIERDSRREPRAEALTRRAFEMKLNRVRRQALRAVAPRHFRRQHRADGAVDVANRQMNLDRLLVLERVLRTARSVCLSSAFSRPWSCISTQCSGSSGPTSGRCRIALRSTLRAFQCSIASLRVEAFDVARPSRRPCGSPTAPCIRALPPR